MVHAAFRFPSRALGRNLGFHVLLPKPQSLLTDGDSPMRVSEKKCLWFFHGVGDDGEAVLLHTDIAALCDELDLVVLLPDLENSFCLDVEDNLRFRTYLTEELIPYTTRIFGLSPRREDHLLGGISMGGYGACCLGLEQAEFFSKVFCLSGALDLRAAARFSRACGIVLPAPLTAKEPFLRPGWDLLALLDRAADAGGAVPEFLLICSKLDTVYKANVRFAERAAEREITAELRSAPGLHDWQFWRENLRPAVEWAVQ